MKESSIRAEKITTPFQLLAAWLSGLIATNGSFLLAASNISQPVWVPGALVAAAIANVFVFLGALFLLQTKFRAELQDDLHYSQYLKDKYGQAEYASLELKVGDTPIRNIRKAAAAAHLAAPPNE